MIRTAFYRRRFTGQVDACFLREAKSLKILIKFLRAEVLADCDKNGLQEFIKPWVKSSVPWPARLWQ